MKDIAKDVASELCISAECFLDDLLHYSRKYEVNVFHHFVSLRNAVARADSTLDRMRKLQSLIDSRPGSIKASVDLEKEKVLYSSHMEAVSHNIKQLELALRAFKIKNHG